MNVDEVHGESVAAANGLVVAVGAVVEVEWDDGVRDIYRIGIAGESDPGEKIIGADAPVAAAICGASEGDVRQYTVRGGWRSVTVVHIHSEEGGACGC